MKCPKCSYLGFETGNRCKNCGYNFSLLTVAESDPDFDQGRSDGGGDADYPLHQTPEDEPSIEIMHDRDRQAWHSDAPAWETMRSTEPAAALDAALPLFNPSDHDDDQPLVTVPAVPRAPLAVRRTPDTPRLRTPTRLPPHPPALALQFSYEPAKGPSHHDKASANRQGGPGASTTSDPTGATTRLLAALIDYAILIGIDVAVAYLTVRMAGLSMSEWNRLPLVPMLTFLGLLKVSYFYAFTALGGQTIGKMAMGTCVISNNGESIGAAVAMRRTCAGAVSLLLCGLGFVPALFGARRALHDRFAGTRVVRLPSV